MKSEMVERNHCFGIDKQFSPPCQPSNPRTGSQCLIPLDFENRSISNSFMTAEQEFSDGNHVMPILPRPFQLPQAFSSTKSRVGIMFLSHDFVSEMDAGQMGSLHLVHPSYESNCVDSVYPPDKSQKKPEARSRSHLCRQESNMKKSKAKTIIDHRKCKSPKVNEKASPRPGGSIQIGVNDAVFGRGGEANKLRKSLKLFGSLIDQHSISYSASDNVEKKRIVMEIIHDVEQAGGQFFVLQKGELLQTCNSHLIQTKIRQKLRDNNLLPRKKRGYRCKKDTECGCSCSVQVHCL